MKNATHNRISRLLSLLILVGLASPASKVSAGVNVWTTDGPGGGDVRALAIDPANPATLYAGTLSAGVFKSTDGGGSWTAINTGMTTTDVRALAIDPANPATLYAGTSGGVFRNDEIRWTAVNAGLTSADVRALAIDRWNGAIYVGTSGAGVFKSTNGGESWTGMNAGLTSTDVRALTITEWIPHTLYAGTLGGVFSNDGVSWTVMNAGLTNTDVSALVIDPGGYWDAETTLYAGTSGGVFRGDGAPYGARWTTLNAGLNNTVVHALAIPYPVCCPGPGTAYAGTEGGVFKMALYGDGTWTAINTGLMSLDVRALAFNPDNGATLYAGTRGAGAFKSTNGGGSWTTINTGLTSALCAPDPTTLCLGGGRFNVTTQWTTPAGLSGSGQAVALAGGETGYFTFFDPGNVEVAVKVLNGCGVNRNFWIFAGGLTDVGVVMTVTDGQTGAIKSYSNPQGTRFRPIQDTTFSTCDVRASAGARPYDGSAAAPLLAPKVAESIGASATEPCVGNATTLCLSNSRYKVQIQWFVPDFQDFYDSPFIGGAGNALPLTGDSGAFWIFSPGNVELVVKVLNGCDVNSRYWTFAAGLTNVNVILTVTDTQTGAIQTYINPQGTPFEPIQDTNAFASCPQKSVRARNSPLQNQTIAGDTLITTQEGKS